MEHWEINFSFDKTYSVLAETEAEAYESALLSLKIDLKKMIEEGIQYNVLIKSSHWLDINDPESGVNK